MGMKKCINKQPINNCFSKSSKIDFGVPLDSIVGPHSPPFSFFHK